MAKISASPSFLLNIINFLTSNPSRPQSPGKESSRSMHSVKSGSNTSTLLKSFEPFDSTAPLDTNTSHHRPSPWPIPQESHWICSHLTVLSGCRPVVVNQIRRRWKTDPFVDSSIFQSTEPGFTRVCGNAEPQIRRRASSPKLNFTRYSVNLPSQ